MTYLVALDQGTTSSRAIVFDADAQPIATAQREFTQHFPTPGWVEHDPGEIWASQSGVLVEAMEIAGVRAAEVEALGITNQRETTLVWDRATGEPIHHAIVWQDRRTAEVCARLRADGVEQAVRAKTGLVLDPYFSGTKLAWILDNIEGARGRAARGELAFGTVDSWLAWQLTGGEAHVTDPSNASRTLLCNIHTGAWDPELLEIFNVPPEVLPEIRSSSAVYGEVAAVPEARGVALAGALGDQQAALLGQACIAPGMAKNTYGTGCFLLLNTGERAPSSDHQLLSTVAWGGAEKLTYALEGAVFVGGAIVQWLRDGLGVIERASDIEALASSVPDSGGVVFVPALTGLGAPHWDPHARGTIQGLTRGTTKAHLARAALEGIALQVADLADAMARDTGSALTELRVDGGASANNLLMQMQADLLGVPVVRSKVTETTALGAAYAAGMAVGVWDSPETIAAHWRADQTFEPGGDASGTGALRERWIEAVARSRNWAEGEA